MARISAKNVMQKYIGTKALVAVLMTLGDYNLHRGWNIPADEDPAKEGYLVQYEDGYISWSPKEVFEESYITENGYQITSESSKLHEQRVIVEAEELFEKIIKLGDFIEKNSLFETLPVDEQKRMKLQLVTMKCYYSVLVERINNFSGLIAQEFIDGPTGTDGIGTIKSVEEVDAEIKSLNSAIELTFGQKAVGASFNPSFMPEVDKVKMLFGETIDIMEEHHKKECEVLGASYMRNVNRTESLNAVIRASSAIVKYLTWRD